MIGMPWSATECVKHDETDDNGANGLLKKVVIRAIPPRSADQLDRLGG